MLSGKQWSCAWVVLAQGFAVQYQGAMSCILLELCKLKFGHHALNLATVFSYNLNFVLLSVTVDKVYYRQQFKFKG